MTNLFQSKGWLWPFTNSRKNFKTAKLTGISHTAALMTNQRPVLRSRDQFWAIRGQYSGHVTSIDQSEASVALQAVNTWLGDEPRDLRMLKITLSWPRTLQNLFILIKLKGQLLRCFWSRFEREERIRLELFQNQSIKSKLPFQRSQNLSNLLLYEC